ncbi:MAG: hypothetical protein J0H73_11885 [Salana multivorans]|uniref:hypothetical protein n=1 Tax=Salana multivorans TaxID=120377 RepID=UPI00095A19D8|nr:hypothetical protein [Salana multivorans]MBN8883000.1 hypothetical protein [Salana multivorans]OJX94048.1 MAG: hypothetical protein BGO96_09585 [Micrococcales bacterium 73-15]
MATDLRQPDETGAWVIERKDDDPIHIRLSAEHDLPHMDLTIFGADTSLTPYEALILAGELINAAQYAMECRPARHLEVVG